jgi:CBS-domain-containing membrane protein
MAESLLDENHFHGFPVVSDNQLLIGYVTADKLNAGIGKHYSQQRTL